MTSTLPTMVLDHGGAVYTVTSVMSAPQELKPGAYRVRFNKLSGFRLEGLDPLTPPSYRVYGQRNATIDKVIRAYQHFDRSLGVLFEGDKGIGKSSTVMELARQMSEKFSLPVIMVGDDYDGVANFIRELGECVIVMDEFEKTFPLEDAEGNDRQHQFLPLLDGTDSVKRMYLATVNDTEKLSPFFLNRPGRFHYLISFDYPSLESITEYLSNETVEASDSQISEAVSFAYRAQLNYDQLRALVKEINIHGQSIGVAELVADLNIRDTEVIIYNAKIILEDGTEHLSSHVEVNFFARVEGSGDAYETVRFLLSKYGEPEIRLDISFQGADAALNRKSGVVTLSAEDIVRQSLRIDVEARKYPKEVLDAHDHAEYSSYMDVDLDKTSYPEFLSLRASKVEFVPVTYRHNRFF